MRRRDLLSALPLAAIGAAIPRTLPGGGPLMLEGYRNTREVSAALCTGIGVDGGIGWGYSFRVLLGSSRVRRVVGVDLEPAICAEFTAETIAPHSVVCADVFAFLDTLPGGSLDFFHEDLYPLRSPDGSVLGIDYLLNDGLRARVFRVLRPSGAIVRVVEEWSDYSYPELHPRIEIRMTALSGQRQTVLALERAVEAR